jgi:hypothetical protein
MNGLSILSVHAVLDPLWLEAQRTAGVVEGSHRIPCDWGERWVGHWGYFRISSAAIAITRAHMFIPIYQTYSAVLDH